MMRKITVHSSFSYHIPLLGACFGQCVVLGSRLLKINTNKLWAITKLIICTASLCLVGSTLEHVSSSYLDLSSKTKWLQNDIAPRNEQHISYWLCSLSSTLCPMLVPGLHGSGSPFLQDRDELLESEPDITTRSSRCNPYLGYNWKEQSSQGPLCHRI